MNHTFVNLGQKAKVKGQNAKVKGQKAKVCELTLFIVNFIKPNAVEGLNPRQFFSNNPLLLSLF